MELNPAYRNRTKQLPSRLQLGHYFASEVAYHYHRLSGSRHLQTNKPKKKDENPSEEAKTNQIDQKTTYADEVVGIHSTMVLPRSFHLSSPESESQQQ